jgi:hypothetical protein
MARHAFILWEHITFIGLKDADSVITSRVRAKVNLFQLKKNNKDQHGCAGRKDYVERKYLFRHLAIF